MNNWRAQLRDADPVAGNEHVPMPHADAVRRVVVSVARSSEAPHAERWLRSALAMAATIALVVSVGVVAGRRLADADRAEPPSAATPSPGPIRQLQFSTPGGTRIIWIFNPDLKLNETLP